MPPVVVGLLASSARTIFDSRFAVDAGEGVYTALDFARKISDAPILILPLAVALVVFPYVSEWASRENREMFTRSLLSMTRVMAFIFVPMAVGVIVLALPAIQFLYQGEGAFTVEDSYMVRRALIPYAVGIPFFAVESSLDKWYFALGDTATPNYVGAVMAGLHVLIAWFGVHVLGRNVGIIALALTASKGIKVIVLYAWLRRRLEAISRSEMLSFIGRLAVATAVLVVALLAGERAFGGLLVDAGRLQRGIYLVLCSGVGAVAYLIAALALRLEEVTEVIGFVRSKLLRRRGKG
jgi:putative peptidoglycan lipid II flippase